MRALILFLLLTIPCYAQDPEMLRTDYTNWVNHANCEGAWKMDYLGDDVKAKITDAVLDLSGNNRHGNRAGTAPFITGYEEGGLECDQGGRDYLYIGEFNDLDPDSSDFTVCMWIKATDTQPYSTGTGYPCAKGNMSSGLEGYSILVTDSGHASSPNTVYVRCNASDSTAQRASQTIGQDITTDNAWHHIALVIDRSDNQIRGYLDGTNTGWNAGGGGPADDDITGFGAINCSDNLRFGEGREGGTFAGFDGYIDECIIFKGIALTEAQITDIYNNGLR